MEAFKEIFNSPAFNMILGGFFTYFVAIRLADHAIRNSAGAKLRDSLYDFLAWLKENPNMFFPYYFDDIARRQLAAALEFKSFLRGCKKRGFEKAWRKYCEPKDKHEWQVAFRESPEEFEKRIESVVKFTRKRTFFTL